MRHLTFGQTLGRSSAGARARLAGVWLAAAALAAACGGNDEGGSDGGSGGGTVVTAVCGKTAKGATRGSAIAVTQDDKRLVAVNRDSGTVTVMAIDYGDGQPKTTVVPAADGQPAIAVGAEPWQVAIDACGTTAWVVSRKDQKLVEIVDLDKSPRKGRELAVGSEPTAVAVTPNNRKIYVANWVDGTLTVVDPSTMTATATVDLNGTLVTTGLLGDKIDVQGGSLSLAPRPAMAHPRALAISNNGDASDDDETVYATEWLAQRTAPESADGKNSDTNREGLLYKVAVASGKAGTIALPPVADTGLNSPVGPQATGTATGCYPNQLASVSIDGHFAYVTSTCASPVGPTGAFTKGACTSTAFCAAEFGAASTCANGFCSVGGSCKVDGECGFGGTCNTGTGRCNPNPNNFKTTTHPAVSVVDLSEGAATTTNLDKPFAALPSSRVPLLQQDIDFRPGFAYSAAEGTDAVFRLTLTNGAISGFGAGSGKEFINLRKTDPAGKQDPNDKLLRLPIGIATTHGNDAFAFVANYGSRDVTALNLGSQQIAGTDKQDFRIGASAALPAAGTPEESLLKGRRFFVTGLGRWSLAGQGWGSCEACHVDGLSDNVTWYFARGPRQSVSLDGSFASKDPKDRRIFNWTAIFDEVADFEGNVRGISGGVGAIVSANNAPPTAADRIDTAAESPPQQGLQGSSADTADPKGTGAHPHSVISDWTDIDNYVKSIRSPRRPTNLSKSDVDAGRDLFGKIAQGNCVACHSGPKWTLSRVFYAPSDSTNAALATLSWNTALNGFPPALLPSTVMGQQFMRFGAPPGAEQLQCALRPVGTIGAPVGGIPAGVSPAAVNVVELRQDMYTPGQGAADTGRGFNVPSLLGLQVGAPYFHAGNARTLEEALGTLFKGHYQTPLASVFNLDAGQVRQLTAFLLSIDEDVPDGEIPAIPAKGANGGDLCFFN